MFIILYRVGDDCPFGNRCSFIHPKDLIDPPKRHSSSTGIPKRHSTGGIVRRNTSSGTPSQENSYRPTNSNRNSFISLK